MVSNNNLKNILTSLFNKSKQETDAQYNQLSTEMNKGWISSGNANKITNGNEVNDTPVGTIISVMGNSAPVNYLICDGTEYNIEDYTELANFFNIEFGKVNQFGGDGTTTFKVPDLRGEFLRGTGTNSHTNQGNGSTVGTHQNGTLIPNFNWSSNSNQLVIFTDVPNATGKASMVNPDKVIHNSSRYLRLAGTSTANTEGGTHYASRPTNTSVLYCIKYKTTSSIDISLYESHKYSEDEQLIGQWLDGKPLYRKTYVKNVTINSITMNFDISDWGIETVVRLNGIATNTGGSFFEFPYGNEKLVRIQYMSDSKVIHLYNGDLWKGDYKLYIYVEYTKTTDTAYSIDEDISWFATDSEVDDIINRLGE